MNEADGLLLLNEVPSDIRRGQPRRSDEDNGEHCYLWVIDTRGRPCISEAPLQRLGSERLHHTNLTGGGQASIGGEIWFGEPHRVYLSGSSGRYPPSDPVHLEEAEHLFREVGFEVVALGWDEETNRPQRVWHGVEQVSDE